MRTIRVIGTLAFGMGLALVVAWLLTYSTPIVRAASLSVNTTSDENDGCGVGQCSLRDAIIDANSSGSDDTITVPAGTYTLTQSTGGPDATYLDLDITSSNALTIVGAGPSSTIINANGIDRVLEINSGAGTVVISGVTVMGGSANMSFGTGGGICNWGADLVLVNTVIISNAASGGGGVYVEGGSTMLDGVQIVSNSANFGGGVSVSQGSVTLSSGQISSNTTVYHGGGVYVGSANATFTQIGDSLIAGNDSDILGGGFYVDQGRAMLSGGRIVSNTASSCGGGVYINEAIASVTLADAIVVESNHAGDGGGVYIDEGSLTLSSGQISSNTSSSHGGGVYMHAASAAFTQTGNSLIVGNTANGDGGGFYISSGRVMLSGGQIVSNAANYGGGMVIGSGHATLSGGQIVSNTARNGYGGGVHIGSGSLTVQENSLIAHNVATGTVSARGGGIYISSGSVELNASQLANNTAKTSGGGAFVSIGTASLVMNGGEIGGNTAQTGGGIYVSSGKVTLMGGEIVSNTAGAGGGVYVNNSAAVLTQTGSTLIAHNVANANYGGGLGVANGRVSLSGGQVVSNTAQYGGGLCNMVGSLTLVNTTVSGNRATAGDGGGLRSNGGTTVITYTTIASNTASGTGGGIYRAAGTVLVQNTIIAYNGTNCGGTVTSNGHNLEYGISCALNAAGDISNTNPYLGLLTYEMGTLIHPLQPNSPAINAGVCLADVTKVDQRGMTRVSPCDIGAYERVMTINLPLVLRNH